MKKMPSKARRPEMNVSLGAKTIARFKSLYADNDYKLIEAMITELPTTSVTVSKHLNSAADNPDWKMPLSIAKAAQKFYAQKEREQKSVDA
jgi:hypothetical protein